MRGIIFIFLLMTLSGCASLFEEKLTLKPVAFSDLKGWKNDSLKEALPALLKSCEKKLLAKTPKNIRVADQDVAAERWLDVCQKATLVNAESEEDIRAFFEQNFSPYYAKNNWRPWAKFTGYFLIELHGSRQRTERFAWPIYRLPTDADKRFTRKEIDAGALQNKGLELMWVDDPVALFFLHIQGSGVVTLEDGEQILVGYAGQNGQPYTAIGAYMKREGFLSGKISAQMIQAWLRAHPEKAISVMQENPSYVYFRELSTKQPLGAESVELTPWRSLAVDSKYVPLGVPVWIKTELNNTDSRPEKSFSRLVMAQDKGGAIKGPIRGDIYMGAGEEAEDRAGFMNNSGRMYVLLPLGAKKHDASAQ